MWAPPMSPSHAVTDAWHLPLTYPLLVEWFALLQLQTCASWISNRIFISSNFDIILSTYLGSTSASTSRLTAYGPSTYRIHESARSSRNHKVFKIINRNLILSINREMMKHRRETLDERRERSKGNFNQVENSLSLSSSSVLRISPWVAYFSSFLGKKNPLEQRADPEQHTVWLLDNTAYQTAQRNSRHKSPWSAEVVACIFEKHGREDIGKWVGIIADLVGLDGNFGMDKDVIRKRIAKRIQPFVNSVAPARFVTLDVPITRNDVHKYKLNPSNKDGIISHTIRVEPRHTISDGTVVYPELRQWSSRVSMATTFAAPDGWAIISDVDDTIKYTQTRDAIGILRTTFVEKPKPITYMPELYQHIQRELVPTWFYLSASPYNLYPFLREFIHSLFPGGTLLLRENSWMDIAGLLRSFTQGTQEYKVGRMEQIHRWFPRRKILCIGDSTQSDPESYAEMYRKQSNWIKAIYIRKVTDVANMDDKNTDERFEKAFEGVPRSVWKVFEHPDQMFGPVDDLLHSQRHSRGY